MRDFDWLVAGAAVIGTYTAMFGIVLMVSAQHLSRTSLGMGLSCLFVGTAVPVAVLKAGEVGDGPELLARAEGLIELCVVLSLILYLDGLAATSQTPPGATGQLRVVRRVIFVLAGVITVAGLVDPAARLNDFELRALDPEAYSTSGFWLYTILWVSLTAPFVYYYAVLFRVQLDVGEDARAVAGLIGTPLLASSIFLPPEVGGFTLAVTFATVLYGQFRYAVAQGERGVFLSRFLSPHVAEQVRTTGLTAVMEPGELDLTVVACDLRGFTAYAEGVPSQAVIDLLGEYYQAVGEAVAEVDGTIKDYAGDGILVLVGAPLPRPDHAEAGLALARRIHQVTAPVIARWSTGPHPLGIGVGAASGRVTVGAIGSSARLEYTAVGSAVNLAARLCSVAASGETLVDERVAAAGGTDAMIRRDPLALKGFGSQVAVFALASDAEARAVAGEPPS